MFTGASRVGPLTSQQEISELLANVADAISNKPDNLSKFGEALATLQTGISHSSLQGDYLNSEHYVMIQPRRRMEGNFIAYPYGRTTLRWRRVNVFAISARQAFDEEVQRGINERMIVNPAPISAAVMETIRNRARGDAVKREQVLMQCGIITQMLKSRLNESYWEFLLSTSSTFNFGVANRDLLSVIEGIRNSVANPNAEVNDDAAGVNREKAESELKELKLPVKIQINHYDMKRLLESYIENIRRTSSVWSDTQIIKIILSKLEQENIFKDIERLWSTDPRFNGCDNFDLFWKILEAEYNLFAVSSSGKEWLKSWQGGSPEVNYYQSSSSNSMQVSRPLNTLSSSMPSSSSSGSIVSLMPKRKDPIVERFEAIPCCHDHLKYKFKEFLTPCVRGDSCRYAHWEDTRASSEVGADRAKAAFDRALDKRKRTDMVDRSQAQALYKQFKSSDKKFTRPPQVFAANAHTQDIDEEEFEAFFAELQSDN
jgi:hypothetical protein